MYGAIEYQHCKVTDPKLNAAGKANPNPLVECQQCESRFAGGPYRIRGHILRISNRGGGVCTSNTPAAVEARAMFQKVEEQWKLVNVFSNLRFLKRVQRVGFEEQVWSWET